MKSIVAKEKKKEDSAQNISHQTDLLIEMEGNEGPRLSQPSSISLRNLGNRGWPLSFRGYGVTPLNHGWNNRVFWYCYV